MMNKKKVAFYTLGCKLNFSETSTISRLFNEEEFKKVEFHETPDIYVINTCSVTDNADKKCKKLVAQALKHNSQAYIAITGCYAQLKPEEIASIPGVDLVLGASEKFNILEYIKNYDKKPVATIHHHEIKHHRDFFPSYSEGDRTRTFFKVQDGCDYFCSFCTIPLARGRSRSATIEQTMAAISSIAHNNVKEIILTGVNIGDFGTKNGETFFDLIRELDKIEGIERFRISSIEPNLLTPEIISFVGNSKKFVPHFHLPLQSGSDQILKAMRRKYLRNLYAERVQLIKSALPDCCIGVDVIVGFPGETEQDFMDTYNFINELDVSYLHVFTYSERENTTAIKIKEVVPMRERNKRSKMLHILSEKKKRFFYEQQKGKIKTVLFEAENDGQFMYGFTENYIKVRMAYDPMLVNETRKVRLLDINEDGDMNCREYHENPVLVHS